MDNVTLADSNVERPAAMHYHVGNNTPGYIPDEDPYCSETLAHAKLCLREDVEHWTEDDCLPEWLEPLCDNDCDRICLIKHEQYEVSFDDDGEGAYVHDRSKMYDLGRSFWIVRVSDTECSEDGGEFEREDEGDLSETTCAACDGVPDVAHARDAHARERGEA